MTQRTLASRGFVLPATPPKVGRKDLDCREGWHTMALRLVIRDFLEPDLRGETIQQANSLLADQIIDRAAAADGFAWMGREIHRARFNPIARECVASWLGIPVEQIWPHHAQASARPVSAVRIAPAALAQVDSTPGVDADEGASLMVSPDTAPPAVCLPFVRNSRECTPPHTYKRLAALALIALAGLALHKRGGAE